MALAINIANGCGLSYEAYCELPFKKRETMLLQ